MAIKTQAENMATKTGAEKNEPFLTLNANTAIAAVLSFILSGIIICAAALLIVIISESLLGSLIFSQYGTVSDKLLRFNLELAGAVAGLGMGALLLIQALVIANVARAMKLPDDLQLRGIIFCTALISFAIEMFVLAIFFLEAYLAPPQWGMMDTAPMYMLKIIGSGLSQFGQLFILYMLAWCALNFGKVKPHLKNAAIYLGSFGLLMLIHDTATATNLGRSANITGLRMPLDFSWPYSILDLGALLSFILSLAFYAGPILAYAYARKKDIHIFAMPLALTILGVFFDMALRLDIGKLSALGLMQLFATIAAAFIFSKEKKQI